MADWAPKRFWKQATISQQGEAWAVLLDSRTLRTPAKAHLLVGSAELAQAVADEWQAQGEVIRPDTMPFTRAVNVAIDHIGEKRDAVVAEIAGYGGTDMLCYREEESDALAQHQAAQWDPLLDWAADHFGARLVVQQGIMPVAQDPIALSRLQDAVAAHSDIGLAALHDLVSLSGSLILGLAVAHGRLSADEAWTLSRLDENWQIAQWGEDEEAAEMTRTKAASFLSAAQLYAVSR
ncbi:ATP12 family chaperone protein [Ketogulonicigenium vulgare]|uniref:ATP12 ATPase n=1 Tax=Ketogulonicigenium vulgare (strain WSH-001) TaxID=759362 RepID=F9Y5A4_KETVW|nr:ATP12 family protein [Ketogulonicigenium vulgare]ADO43641.1 ATP12 chaperone protein [Ketogulonicigenium vulgare Y25]AEM41909.1 ATP12 ATPase [Ketogulonicigenium vulgare WSH-001]ALJ82012.1 ATPase [Ketogulonicigenium vulgare]ANW34647.1 ATPase [Ketogulonicigenium vulgare]